MNEIGHAFSLATSLVGGLDADLSKIVLLSLRVSLSATAAMR